MTYTELPTFTRLADLKAGDTVYTSLRGWSVVERVVTVKATVWAVLPGMHEGEGIPLGHPLEVVEVVR